MRLWKIGQSLKQERRKETILLVESRKVANTNTDKNTNTNTDKNTNTITELVEAGEEEGAKTVG